MFLPSRMPVEATMHLLGVPHVCLERLEALNALIQTW